MLHKRALGRRRLSDAPCMGVAADGPMTVGRLQYSRSREVYMQNGLNLKTMPFTQGTVVLQKMPAFFFKPSRFHFATDFQANLSMPNALSNSAASRASSFARGLTSAGQPAFSSTSV